MEMTDAMEERLVAKLQKVRPDEYIGGIWFGQLTLDGQFSLKDLQEICRIWHEETRSVGDAT